MTQKAFLTEVSVLDEFKPPQISGVKVAIPPAGEKDLIFPEVRPKKYISDSPGQAARIFGIPRWRYGGKRAVKDAPHLKSHNLLCHDAHIMPAGIPSYHSSQWSENSAPQSTDGPAVSAARLATSGLDGKKAQSGNRPSSEESSSCCCSHSASSRCSCSCSCSCSVSISVPSRHTPKMEPVNAGQNQQRSPSVRSIASVASSAFEGLVSVSQVGSHHGSYRSAATRSTLSTAARSQLLKLESELNEERRQRERTQAQLDEVQRRQEALLAKLKAMEPASP